MSCETIRSTRERAVGADVVTGEERERFGQGHVSTPNPTPFTPHTVQVPNRFVGVLSWFSQLQRSRSDLLVAFPLCSN